MEREESLPKTDPTRWRLRTNEEGVHYWIYLAEESVKEERPQAFPEKYFLGLPRVLASLFLPPYCRLT